MMQIVEANGKGDKACRMSGIETRLALCVPQIRCSEGDPNDHYSSDSNVAFRGDYLPDTHELANSSVKDIMDALLTSISRIPAKQRRCNQGHAAKVALHTPHRASACQNLLEERMRKSSKVVALSVSKCNWAHDVLRDIHDMLVTNGQQMPCNLLVA